jgi:hypothetical protein
MVRQIIPVLDKFTLFTTRFLRGKRLQVEYIEGVDTIEVSVVSTLSDRVYYTFILSDAMFSVFVIDLQNEDSVVSDVVVNSVFDLFYNFTLSFIEYLGIEVQLFNLLSFVFNDDIESSIDYAQYILELNNIEMARISDEEIDIPDFGRLKVSDTNVVFEGEVPDMYMVDSALEQFRAVSYVLSYIESFSGIDFMLTDEVVDIPEPDDGEVEDFQGEGVGDVGIGDVGGIDTTAMGFGEEPGAEGEIEPTEEIEEG